MSFGRPELLWLAVALPALVGLGVWLWARRRRRVAAALGSAELIARIGGGDLQAFPRARLVLLALAAAALGLAAADPRWGTEEVEERSSAADIVLALDVSRSMLARDLRPNRLERQRVLARRVLRELPGDRIGLVAFAGRAYVLSPMTVDHSALHLYLDALDPEIVSQGGSAISSAVRQASDLARGPADAGRGIVVLVTDGEALEERDAVLQAADRAARLGITIHTVGIGTTSGSPIPAGGDPERGEGYVRGPDGEIVVSRLDEALLREVARRAGGRYLELGDAGSTDALVRTLRGVERVEGEARQRVRQRERFAWFVLVALALLVVDGWLAGRGAGSGGARVKATEVVHA